MSELFCRMEDTLDFSPRSINVFLRALATVLYLQSMMYSAVLFQVPDSACIDLFHDSR